MKRLLFLIALAAVVVHAGDFGAGRQIYVSGKGGQPIAATMAGSTELPASMLPCVNCHGADGRGTTEGGVVASNITWDELTKPYRAATPNGRRRPAYNEKTLRRAIAEGIDSAGNPLHAAMPRYAMTDGDFAALAAYLQLLGRESVPGVTETAVRIGTIVPDNPAGSEMAAVLSACFAEAGEIHGRRLTLEVVQPSALQDNPPFALAAGITDAAAEEAVERAGIPLVLPVSLRGDASAENRQRFYLHPGLEDQLRGLLRFSGVKRAAILAGSGEMAAVARRAAGDEVAIAERADDSTAVVFLDPDAKLASIPVQGTSPLLFLGNLLPADFFKEAPAYGSRIRVALTTTPADLTGIAEYRAFAARHSITGPQIASQLSAYAAAKALVHALKLSGRTLTRDGLRASLESLYEFDTGVTPPLTFGRGRRTAVPRVHVATVDARGNLAPAGTFQTND
ncbi:MAG TPA: c-type cytochrome [Thermoanaerobaculia bacterium]|nr:c-type cytochrome [Thermoanaerobaculia bacterium]